MIPDETHFLDALREGAEKGQTPADELLAEYHGTWAGDLSKTYATHSA